MSTSHSNVARVQPDYFSTTHLSLSHDYNHFSTESPCCSPVSSPTEATPFPQHPLLACRESTFHTMPAASSLLQIQTAASHGPPSRPQLQNVLHVTSDESTTSNSSKSSMDLLSCSPEFARCSRCHRTSSVDYKTGQSNFLRYGLNLYYCNRCAAVTGMTTNKG